MARSTAARQFDGGALTLEGARTPVEGHMAAPDTSSASLSRLRRKKGEAGEEKGVGVQRRCRSPAKSHTGGAGRAAMPPGRPVVAKEKRLRCAGSNDIMTLKELRIIEPPNGSDNSSWHEKKDMVHIYI
ncbi:hypothetical protein U9M48_003491 [Paspalum notatum var. saurae]|uniref:Uncharacterized protein n=1 Tax=Paspalum notatum var. saurae TaxID=547442 RepID=A0AAQ3PLM9_PASNO